MKLELRGIWSPMPTPLDGQGNVDLKRLEELTDYLIRGGIDGLFPLGTTGEFALMSRDERKKIIETVARRADSRVPVVAGISDPSPQNAISYAKDASEAGADGAVATPPYYYSVGEDGLYDHFKLISESIPLPLILYNIPEWTHNFVPVSVVSRLAKEGAIAGMKYTEYNLLKLVEFIRSVGKDISVLTGSDAMTCACLEAGGSGAVISVSNILPSKAASIYDLYREGKPKEANMVQQAIFPAIEAAGVGYFPAGLKEAMKLAGFDVGGVRRPQSHLTDDETERVRVLMNTAGLK